MKRLKFINKSKDKNIGFSKNEINVLVQELNIQNDIFLNYLENAGKKSNILNTNFVDVNEYVRLQKEFRNLIDNDSEINLKSSSVCYFNFTIDHFHNKYFYFIKTNDKLTNPNIFYYSKLYAFAYNLLYLLKINAKAYNNEDTSRFCKREKKRSKTHPGSLCGTCWSSSYRDSKNRTGKGKPQPRKSKPSAQNVWAYPRSGQCKRIIQK